jgi:hypothetical protein
LGHLAGPQLTTAGSSAEAYTQMTFGDASVFTPDTLAASNPLAAYPYFHQVPPSPQVCNLVGLWVCYSIRAPLIFQVTSLVGDGL